MPELPDVVVYVEHLERRLVGARLERIRVRSVNLLRTAEPPIEEAFGREVRGVTRLGKRIVIELEGAGENPAERDGRGRARTDLDAAWFLAIHLMISGRFRWSDAGPKPVAIPGRVGLAAFDFDRGTLLLTEASSHQRASLHLLSGRAALRALDPGGIEPLEVSLAEFAAGLRREAHTLKRSLTDPRLFSGIGNAYSDEILHRSRLSPLRRSAQLDDAAIEALWRATREVLIEWTERLRTECGDRFPDKVTAFRKEMAVHGRYKLPCPVCGAPVQRIVYAENETNYCARCQTGGKLLADRALSRLLKRDWPKTLEELEG